MVRHFLLCLALVGLMGCSTMKPEDFANTGPRFVLEDYFAGTTKAWGLFQDRFGTVRRQFYVDIEGTWDGSQLTLVEDFVYDDGETEQRIWKIRKIDEHTYEGTAGDVIGTASGRRFGNALNWKYDFNLKVGEDRWKVHFDDWMFLQPGGVLINRATVTKWGVELGEVTLFFRRAAQQSRTEAAE
jgi:hypothetical protein